jgi:O-6-methylguanine DNA methyltransferase
MRDLKPDATDRWSSHRLAEGLNLSLGISWQKGRIVGTSLLESTDRDEVADGPLGLWIGSWNRGLTLPGLPEDLLDWSAVPLRTRAILGTLSQVLPGRTCTYAEVARWAGIPRGFQAVGGAMARNPFVLLVPCHRVLAKDGGLGGYSAGGPVVKRRLLEHEGGLT